MTVDLSLADAPVTPGHFAVNTSRGLWKPKKHLRLINRAIFDVCMSPISRFLMIEVPPRHGKQNRFDEPVFTTRGWRVIGELEPGDEVFGLDGYPTKVLAKTFVDRMAPKLRVTFSDHTWCDVHPNHEWTLYERGGKAQWGTFETRYLMGRKFRSGERSLFQLPERQPLEMPKADLPVS